MPSTPPAAHRRPERPEPTAAPRQRFGGVGSAPDQRGPHPTLGHPRTLHRNHQPSPRGRPECDECFCVRLR